MSKAKKPTKKPEPEAQVEAMPFDDALRKILSAPPAPKVKAKRAKKAKTG